MKTRQELILEFMLALASGIYASAAISAKSEEIYNNACRLADKYLENV